MKTIDRYLLRQLSGPFAFGVFAFVLLFVSADVLFDLMELVNELMELVNELGLGFWTACQLFLLRIPEFMMYTFPLATLVAVLISFGRLSGDSELVAMFAGGISFRRLVLPVIAAGLLVSIATAALGELLVPACNHRAEDILRSAGRAATRAGRENVFYPELSADGIRCTVFAERLDIATGELTRPTIIWYREGLPFMVTTAEAGRWADGYWEMHNGVKYLLYQDRSTAMEFLVMKSELSTSPIQMVSQQLQPEEMTYRQLRERIEYAVSRRLPTAKLELALHHKFSIPFACLVFALVAPPLGMRSHRGSSSIGMGIALLIGFGYYIMYNYFTALAHQGHLAPLFAAWLPDIVTGAVGVALVLSVRK
jgi:lipopolysaccharide export system permease protein